jgi:capsular polysaccharide transport system permease protein
MTNVAGQKLAVDPNHGRKAIDVFTKELNERVRSLSTSRPFVIFVLIAAVILGIYYFLLASPIYVSEASFTIRGREDAPAAVSLLSALGAGGGSSAPSSTDTAELQAYVQSYEMATKLDQQFHLRDIYARPRLDFLNWLPRSASRDAYLNFYRKMVRVSVDHDTNLIDIKVKAFDPKTAQTLATAILHLSADYLNTLSAAVRRDTLKDSEQDLKDAEEHVRQVRMTMTNYRATTGSLDPLATAIATSTGISAMQQEVLELKSDLASMYAYDRPNTPAVAQAEAKIAGLQHEIDIQEKKIADTKAPDSIAERMKVYEGLQINSTYADQQLVAALSSYDAARTLASQRDRFVVPAVPPSLPDEATEPHRLSSFLEALLVLIAVYGIVALAIAGVRDHQGI